MPDELNAVGLYTSSLITTLMKLLYILQACLYSEDVMRRSVSAPAGTPDSQGWPPCTSAESTGMQLLDAGTEVLFCNNLQEQLSGLLLCLSRISIIIPKPALSMLTCADSGTGALAALCRAAA